MSTLKEKRKKAKLKQAELGKAIGVSQKLISIWETGRQELPVRQARKLAEVLGCDWKELYDYQKGAEWTAQ